jgi:hypothetical protein
VADVEFHPEQLWLLVGWLTFLLLVIVLWMLGHSQ